MNIHINGVEVPQLDLEVEWIMPASDERPTAAYMMRHGKQRAIIKGKRGAMDRVFNSEPATLVLERAPTDPQLAQPFARVQVVRIKGRKFQVYRRDTVRNKIWMRRTV